MGDGNPDDSDYSSYDIITGIENNKYNIDNLSSNLSIF
jgi:hypothetical protein